MRGALTRGEVLWAAATIFFLPFVHLMAVLLGAVGAYDRWHNDRLTAFVIFAGLAVIGAGLEVADLR